MTITEAMDTVSRILTRCSSGQFTNPGLYVCEKKLFLNSRKNRKPEHLLVMGLTWLDFAEGLPSEKWNLLQSKLTKLIEEKVL